MSGFHLLGAGAVGCLFAHHLQRAGIPITLLLRSPKRLQEYLAQGGHITMETAASGNQPGTVSTSQPTAELANGGHSGEMAITANGGHGTSVDDGSTVATSPIERLLVTTKANQTLQAMTAVRHRLHKDSVVVLLQNGVLAVHEQLLAELFPDIPTRPAFVLGSTTHGVYRHAPFHVVHAGAGTGVFGQLPEAPRSSAAEASASNADRAPHSPHIHASHQQRQCVLQDAQPGRGHQQQQLVAEALSLLARTTDLHPNISIQPHELQHQLLLKLVVNCCCNPMAALLRCRNGGLLGNAHVASAWEGIIGECKAAFGDALLPDTAAALAAHVSRVAAATSGNINSMLQDVRTGTQTEVDYLNGYVARCAGAKAVSAPWNAMLTALMHAQESCNKSMLLECHDRESV